MDIQRALYKTEWSNKGQNEVWGHEGESNQNTLYTCKKLSKNKFNE